ncbi:MAG: DUF1269 domain-containing protein [Thermomicrobiales bacterium]|nr:DUF1269 domain-containing protein [Thermomicrobiales bacterium]
MAELIVIAFDKEDDAAEALRNMRALEGHSALRLTDTAVVAKDPDGKLRVRNEASSGAEAGAVVGGAIGLLTTFLFPVVGTMAGAAVGAWAGSKLGGNAVDGTFVEDVGKQLEPGKSALFLMVGSADAAGLRAALEPYRGRVYQTTLSTDVEDALNSALKG